MAQVYQNPSQKHLKPDKDRKTINLIINKAYYRNPWNQISNYTSIVLVINISRINVGI